MRRITDHDCGNVRSRASGFYGLARPSRRRRAGSPPAASDRRARPGRRPDGAALARHGGARSRVPPPARRRRPSPSRPDCATACSGSANSFGSGLREPDQVEPAVDRRTEHEIAAGAADHRARRSRAPGRNAAGPARRSAADRWLRENTRAAASASRPAMPSPFCGNRDAVGADERPQLAPGVRRARGRRGPRRARRSCAQRDGLA